MLHIHKLYLPFDAFDIYQQVSTLSEWHPHFWQVQIIAIPTLKSPTTPDQSMKHYMSYNFIRNLMNQLNHLGSLAMKNLRMVNLEGKVANEPWCKN